MQIECYSPTGNKVCQSLLQSQVMLWSVFLSQHHLSGLVGAKQCCRKESYGRCGKLLYFLCFYLPNGFCIQWNFWPLWRGVTLKASSLGPPEDPIATPPPSPACPPSLPSHCWFTQRPATSVSDLARFISVVSWDTFFNLSVKFSLTLKVWFKLSPSFEDFGNLHSEWELLSSCSYGIFWIFIIVIIKMCFADRA